MFIVAWSKGEKFSPPLSDPALGPSFLFTLPPKNNLEHPHSLPFISFEAKLLTVKPGIRKIKMKKAPIVVTVVSWWLLGWRPLQTNSWCK